MTISERVNNSPTKHKEGFIASEIESLLKEYPKVNMKKFNEALSGITGMMIDGEFVTFHSDIENALRYSVKVKFSEQKTSQK